MPETLYVNEQNNKGNTPIHEALLEGKIELAGGLIKSEGVNPNLQNNYGSTYLHILFAQKYNFSTHVADGKDINQEEASDYSRKLDDLIKYLLRQPSIRVDIKDEEDKTPFEIMNDIIGLSEDEKGQFLSLAHHKCLAQDEVSMIGDENVMEA